MVELKDGRWVDQNNNSWSTVLTEEQANLLSVSIIDCSDCRDCRDCSACFNCRACSGFKSNPERVVSPAIGSRDDNTTIYFNSGVTQVVCGCFRGTLAEFRDKVVGTHGDNEHAKNYLAWIERVERYIGL